MLRPYVSGTGLDNSEEEAEWRLQIVLNLTIDVWILKSIDGSLSPRLCLGNLGSAEVLGVARMSIMKIGSPVRLLVMASVVSFSCHMIACYFLVNIISCGIPFFIIWFPLGSRMLELFS